MYLGETEEYKEELGMLIEEFLKQRIQGLKNEEGVYVTQAFPKLLYVLEPCNIKKDGSYFYLTKLAAECTAKRMVPDYISEKIMLENKIDEKGNGNVYGCMGCRSFLTPYINKNGEPQYYGRFNQGVVTVNLVDIALSSGGDFSTFWNDISMKEQSYVTKHYDSDMRGLKVHYQMLHLFYIKMGHLQDSKKERKLMNFCIMDIQQFHLDMPGYTNV